MTNQFNDKLFSQFIRLRDDMRKAKREKNYELVLVLGKQILQLDNTARFLKIATPIFLKDMGNACMKLGTASDAAKYFEAAVTGFLELKGQTTDWQTEVAVIERKLKILAKAS
jgi:hypothetical protein